MDRATRQRKRFREYRKRQLADPEFRKGFQKFKEEFQLALSLAKLREERGISQAKLAKKMGTSQAVISRMERGSNVRIGTAIRAAQALNAHLKIEIVPDSDKTI